MAGIIYNGYCNTKYIYSISKKIITFTIAVSILHPIIFLFICLCNKEIDLFFFDFDSGKLYGMAYLL